MFAAGELLAQGGPVGLLEGVSEAGQFALVAFEGDEHSGAVLLENLNPHCGVAGGDAGGVAQAVAGEVSPLAVFLGKGACEGGGEGLRQVADVGDDFVVFFGGDVDDRAAKSAPKLLDGVNGVGGRASGWGDKADPALEKGVGAVLPPRFLATGHGVGSDKNGAGGARVNGGGGADRTLDATDIGYNCPGGKGGADQAVELDDALNRGGEHDQGAADGFLGNGVLGSIGDGVDPRLIAQGGADFGAAGPDCDMVCAGMGAGGAGHGGAEQAGGEDDKMVNRHELRGTVAACFCRAFGVVLEASQNAPTFPLAREGR